MVVIEKKAVPKDELVRTLAARFPNAIEENIGSVVDWVGKLANSGKGRDFFEKVLADAKETNNERQIRGAEIALDCFEVMTRGEKEGVRAAVENVQIATEPLDKGKVHIISSTTRPVIHVSPEKKDVEEPSITIVKFESEDGIMLEGKFYPKGSRDYSEWVEAEDAKRRYPDLPGSPAYSERLFEEVGGLGLFNEYFQKAKRIGAKEGIPLCQKTISDPRLTESVPELVRTRQPAAYWTSKKLRTLFTEFNREMRRIYEFSIDPKGEFSIRTAFKREGHESVGVDTCSVMLTALDSIRGAIRPYGNHVTTVIGAQDGRYITFDPMSGAISHANPPTYEFASLKDSPVHIVGDVGHSDFRPDFHFAREDGAVYFTRALETEFVRVYETQLGEIWESAKNILRADRGLDNPETEKRLMGLFNEQERLRLEFIEKHFKPPRFSIGVIQEIAGDCSVAAIFSALVYSELEKPKKKEGGEVSPDARRNGELSFDRYVEEIRKNDLGELFAARLSEATRQQLRQCPKYIVSNDNALRENGLTTASGGNLAVFVENSRVHSNDSPKLPFVFAKNTWPRSDGAISAQFYKKGTKENATVEYTWGYPTIVQGRKQYEPVDTPLLFQHGKLPAAASISTSAQHEDVYFVSWYQLSGRDNAVDGNRLGIMFGIIELPERLYHEVVEALPDPEKTLNYLYAAFQKEFIDHALPKLLSDERVVAGVGTWSETDMLPQDKLKTKKGPFGSFFKK